MQMLRCGWTPCILTGKAGGRPRRVLHDSITGVQQNRKNEYRDMVSFLFQYMEKLLMCQLHIAVGGQAPLRLQLISKTESGIR